MEIARGALVPTFRGLREKGFDYLKKITAVDYGTYLEVVYLLYDTRTKLQEELLVRLDHQELQLDSIQEIYRAADWYERELSEMFGVRIMNRGRVRRLLLEEWNGTEHPLLKSFAWGGDYRRVEE